MIKRYYRFIILLILSCVTLNIYSNRSLSEKAFISVLTCSEGEELYSAFGHSAIRVCDPKSNIDYVFNYGTFDFDTPNFYLKFANGKLNYMLSYGYFKHFLPEYFRRNRSVNEQLLNLNTNEKQNIFDALINNYKPENRYYKYDFFYDNCATRIYKIISENIEGDIVIESNAISNLSFRNYLHHYLVYSPWIETGLNLLLGIPADNIASNEQSTFLPDFLMGLLDQVKVKNGNKIKNLVVTNKTLIERDKSQLSATLISPAFVGWFILVIVLTLSILYSKKQKSILIYFDRFIFTISGIVGLLLLYLWLVTDHQVTQYNMNVLWTFPTLLVLVFGNYKNKLIQIIMLFNLVLITFFVFGWWLMPQSFPQITLPIAIIIALRIVFILRLNTSLKLLKIIKK